MNDFPGLFASIVRGTPLEKMPEPPDDESDVDAFDAAVAECRSVFIERRRQYGNHFAREAPGLYLQDGLKLKMTRTLDDIRAGRKMKRDTLIDMVDYGLMILSIRHAQEGAHE